MAGTTTENLKGSWDYVDGENFDAFLKEIGVGFMARGMAKGLKPRLIISENNGVWTVRSESSVKTHTYDFTPDTPFDETTADGREVKSIIKFEGDRWVHESTDASGKKSVVVRTVDAKGQQMINMECGNVKASRWYRRV